MSNSMSQSDISESNYSISSEGSEDSIDIVYQLNYIENFQVEPAKLYHMAKANKRAEGTIDDLRAELIAEGFSVFRL